MIRAHTLWVSERDIAAIGQTAPNVAFDVIAEPIVSLPVSYGRATLLISDPEGDPKAIAEGDLTSA